MPNAASVLQEIASARQGDPLAPVTVIVPSHAAGLQMRRRLAEIASFAAVRFEILPRIAELLGAGRLAGERRRPLARPIGDYVSAQVGRESRGRLEAIADLPGYAKALRQIFRRLRRGGVVTGNEPIDQADDTFRELIRLYGLFRDRTSGFYDEEDVLDAAREAVNEGAAGALGDLGELYVVPPGPLTASGLALLETLKAAAPSYHEIEETTSLPEMRYVMAPDPASEVREVVRDVLGALEGGCELGEIGVFHGTADGYPALLRDSFAAAEVPSVPLPGVPLIEKRAGRAAFMLTALPGQDFTRTSVIDFLSVAPLRTSVPIGGGSTTPMTAVWDKLAREAGISKGREQWGPRLRALSVDRQASAERHEREDNAGRARGARFEAEQAGALDAVVEELIRRIRPLERPQPAGTFIEQFKGILDDYLDPSDDALEGVRDEIDQLGTVDAVGGEFRLSTFAEAVEANLQIAHHRPSSLGSGILIGDHRMATGLQFEHVSLCGAYEGALPAGPGVDNLVDDGAWRALKPRFPQIEDVSTRVERAEMVARRAIGSASGGSLTWSCPRFQPGGTREYYPSYLMVNAAQATTGEETTASSLRESGTSSGPVRSVPSPLIGVLRGAQVDAFEGALREAVQLRRGGAALADNHPRKRAVEMLQHRRSALFTEWDGNVSGLQDASWLELQRSASPTSLENYATCGYKYFCRSLLHLNVVDEPEEREMMEPAMRGTLIHDVLDRFFRREKEKGRPAVDEAWTANDLANLMGLLEDALREAEKRGQTGLKVYAEHEARTIRADLAMFLQADTAFRRRTGAVPEAFEAAIPETEIAGVRLRGIVDRIDKTPDGRAAWVIDYKTGSAVPFSKIKADPLVGGTKLQLPTYLAAVGDAEQAKALYWFITRKGEFEEIQYEPDSARDERFRRTLVTILNGIRSGVFPAVPKEDNEFRGNFDNCVYCEYDRICSRRRDHEFAAKADDTATKPWSDVANAASKEASE